MKSSLTEILSPFPVSSVSINSEELARCLELARLHDVEMLFYSRLKKLYAGTITCVDDYLKQSERSYLMNTARSMRQEALEKEIIAAFNKEGISACIIKGNAIAWTIYEDPNCRCSADIDVLIRKADLNHADSILNRDGFVRANSLPLPFCIGRSHHAEYRNRRKNSLIELHWDFGYPLYFDLTPDDIWNGVTGNGHEGYSLTPETMVVMLFAHHFRHGFRPFKILVDILWSFYRYDRVIDWREFAGKLRKFGMIKTAIIILEQLDAQWQLKDAPLESFRILRERLATMAVSTPKFLLRYFTMDIERRIDKMPDMEMAKLVLDRKTKIFYSFIKILFPRPQDIRAFYPNTKEWMLPVNYLRFICWRVTKWTVFTK